MQQITVPQHITLIC